MSDLVAIVYPNEAKAEEVRQRLLKLQKEYLITIGDAVIALIALRRIAVRKITPALMRAFRHRMDPLQMSPAHDVDPAVVAILETQDLDPTDDHVPNDEMQLSADQFVGALRPHPRCEADLTIFRP